MNKKYLIYVLGTVSVISGLYLVTSTAMGGSTRLTGLVTGSMGLEEESEQLETYKIGYCPTMEPHLQSLEQEKIESIPLDSSGQVLRQLNQGNIDAALIGRKARSNEYQGEGKILEQGHTLVSSQGGVIPTDDLDEITVNTYLDGEIQEEYPELNFRFQEKLEDINKDDLMLIDWEDWNEELELVIPLHTDSSKDERFRTPILYTQEDLDEDQILK